MLWIEDEPELMAPLAAWLTRDGFEVNFARTGEAGFSMASSMAFEVILLDFKLPDVLGMDLLDRIKSAGIRTPIIVITGYGAPELAFEVARAGAAGFKSKPLQAVDLVETVLLVIDSLKREEARAPLPHSRR